MATVNKSSLRAEFDALKARFESLCAAGKMSADSRALFDALLMLFELLMAVFMEKHTPKSSANSSLPASQSPNDDTARTRPGAKGKGPSSNGERCANTRTREYVKVLSVDACGRCGEDLTDAACLGHERRTLIDIVFEKVVRHADAQIKHCPRCHAETRACFPHQMPGPLQYGPGIKAYVVHRLIAQMLSLKRVAQSMHALIGRTLSEATLLGYVAQLHHALAEWESHAIERLLAMPAMHVDETSLRVDRKNHWIHVYSAGTLTVKCLHPKRGCEAIEAIGIIPRYGGVTVHDCWASYLSYTHCDHALCGAHLLRELAFIVDAHGYAWAKRMKRLLLGACHQVSKRDDKTLTPSEYKALQKRYRPSSPKGRESFHPSHLAKTASAAKWPNPMPTICGSGCKSTKPPCCASPNTPMSPSPTIVPSATCAWPRSSRKSQDASAPASTPKPIAASQAICSPWRIRATTRWWPFRSLSPDVPLITWVSSCRRHYKDCRNSCS